MRDNCFGLEKFALGKKYKLRNTKYILHQQQVEEGGGCKTMRDQADKDSLVHSASASFTG